MPEPTVFEQIIYVGVPAEKVWQAIVDAEIVEKYHFLPLTRIETKPGGMMAYGEGDPPPISCQILEIHVEQKLVHTFTFSHQQDDPPSRVIYELKPMGEMCELHLTHDQFGGETATYHDVCGGWPVILSALKTLLETGKTLPWPKDES